MAVKSSTILRIVPKKLVGDLSPKEKEQNPLLLDVTLKPGGRESSSYELNVIFQGIAIRCGFLIKSNFYIGVIGAEISITGMGAEVIGHTGSSSISAETTSTTAMKKTSRIKIGPEWESNSGKGKLGGFERGVEKSGESTVKYTLEEALVAATVLGDTMRWNIDTHRGEKIVRDFLLGNKYLNATFKWKDSSRRGNIQIRPDIRYFGPDKRQLSPFASLRVQWKLQRENFKLDIAAGSELSFSEAA